MSIYDEKVCVCVCVCVCARVCAFERACVCISVRAKANTMLPVINRMNNSSPCWELITVECLGMRSESCLFCDKLTKPVISATRAKLACFPRLIQISLAVISSALSNGHGPAPMMALQEKVSVMICTHAMIFWLVCTYACPFEGIDFGRPSFGCTAVSLQIIEQCVISTT